MPYQVSEQFKKEIKYSQNIATKVELLRSGVVDSSVDLQVVQGNATEDKTNAIRWSAGLTFIDSTGELVPENVGDALFPGETEIKLYRGLYLEGQDEPELIPLGVYGFADTNSHYTGGNFTIQIDGFDRSRRVSEHAFEETFSWENGDTIDKVIRAIIAPRVPFAKFDFSSGTFALNKGSFDRGTDPMRGCESLAAAGGKEVFFDRDGVCTLRDEPNISGEPAWSFVEGEESTVLEYHKKVTRSQYNRWWEIGEGSEISVPFASYAEDKQSVERTGVRSTFHVSSFYTDISQTQIAANARKAREQGNVYQMSFQTIPNPALGVGDLTLLYSEPLHENHLYIMEKVVTPLRTDQGQYATTRRKG